MVLFSELGISKATLKSIEKMGFEEATPIQAETIPLAIQGGDVIGQAQTGTGKTAAFGIPMIDKIETKKDEIQGLVIAPTRELAIQVAEELYKLGSDRRIRVLSVYGGQDISRQIRALKKAPHIIVGTPGRLLDHINRKTVRLNTVQTVVLDEADEMLNMGFIEDIESILSQVPAEHQTLLFSATMPDPIRRIAARFMVDPQTVKVKAKEMTGESISQFYVRVAEREKFDAFTRLLDIQQPELAIVFGRTKRRVDELIEALAVRGYNADGIHGDLTQARRMQVLKKFKDGAVDILVATDVAARGLDISGVSHVYNFDIPQDPESYVHRIGRTGRAGKSGIAITFVTPREMAYLEIVEKTTNKKMERIQPPTATDAVESQRRSAKEKLIASVMADDLSSYMNLAQEILEEVSPEQLVAACLKQFIKEPEEKAVTISEERPLPFRRSPGESGRGSRGPREGGRGREGERGRGSRDGGARRSYGDKDRKPSGDGERRSFGDKDRKPSGDGERRRPSGDRERRPSSGGGERRPSAGAERRIGDGSRRPRSEGSERTSSNDRPSGERRRRKPQE
ncbi:MAG: box helicase [Bacillales bacterium]|jgi:ATP-dependent RNA helicase DeaD|nr:box helicase [Bacillales bacterium]